MALVKPGGDRIEHRVYDTTHGTCYLCHRKLASVADSYFTYNMDALLCYDHRGADGYHGQLSSSKDKPYNPMQVVRLLHSSHFKEGAVSRKRRSVVKEPADKSMKLGEMAPEVEEFLKKMGRL